MILQNVRIVVCIVLNNISSTHIFLALPLSSIFHQNCQAAVSINWLGMGGEGLNGWLLSAFLLQIFPNNHMVLKISCIK